MFSWGGASNGELGQGGLEEHIVSSPTRVPFPPATSLASVAAGGRHTLLLTQRGELHSCGSNDLGQLGREGSQTRLEPVPGLAQYTVVTAAAGANHTLAVDQWGSLFSFGSDESGQLGHNQGAPSLRAPRLVKSLGTVRVVAVAAGLYHSAALTASGHLYTWGSNSKGQLGLGRQAGDLVFSPARVESLVGIPLAGLTCGGNHTVVVSRSGAVFAWGSNSHGQLGLGDTTDRAWPAQVATLRNLRVGPGGLAAGLEHTIALTEEGGVFTWGSSRCGQLGHGAAGTEPLPRKILELMGTEVSLVAAGDRHSLAFVPSRGKLYGWGVGGSGQLGRAENRQNALLPSIVLGLEEREVRSIAAGGNSSWCLVRPSTSRDQRFQEPGLALLRPATLALLEHNQPLDQDTLDQLEVVLQSLSCINGSLLTSEHYCCKASNPGVDLLAWRAALSVLASCSHHSVSSLTLTGMLAAMQELRENPPDMETLRFYLIFPLHPAFTDPANLREVHYGFAEKILGLKGAGWKCVERWIAQCCPAWWLANIVTNYKAAAVPLLQLASPSPSQTHSLQVLLLLLRVLNRVNRDAGYPVPYESFYIPEVNSAHDLAQSYVSWLAALHSGVDVSAGFYICNYPFMFDPAAKETILRTDQAYSQQQAQQTAVLQMFLSGQAAIPYLLLHVSRGNIVQETITQLQMASKEDLKKPLRVKFEGEEAEDAGGVTKEFFLLLIKEILNPDYGMFKEYEESNMIWFNPNTFEDNSYYFLIGILCGLAIYNFTIINVPFPSILYKKLLNDSLDYTLSDLAELSPTTARSLQELLDYQKEDVEEVFSLSFAVSQQSFGEVVEVPLKPDGENIPVTSSNKKEYVQLYIDFVLFSSVQKALEAFKTGFLKVVSGRVLDLFHPQELQALVIGNENYDWELLQQLCTYKEGYTAGSQAVVNFWEVFHELTEEDKRKFLLFLTGSDRIPIAGMVGVKMTIQQTNDTTFLPVAHTCFNLLDLPNYGTKDKLKFKLLQAIQCTKGFGLV